MLCEKVEKLDVDAQVLVVGVGLAEEEVVVDGIAEVAGEAVVERDAEPARVAAQRLGIVLVDELGQVGVVDGLAVAHSHPHAPDAVPAAQRRLPAHRPVEARHERHGLEHGLGAVHVAPREVELEALVLVGDGHEAPRVVGAPRELRDQVVGHPVDHEHVLEVQRAHGLLVSVEQLARVLVDGVDGGRCRLVRALERPHERAQRRGRAHARHDHLVKVVVGHELVRVLEVGEAVVGRRHLVRVERLPALAEVHAEELVAQLQRVVDAQRVGPGRR